jgi:hypothetical protein
VALFVLELLFLTLNEIRKVDIANILIFLFSYDQKKVVNWWYTFSGSRACYVTKLL